MEWIVFGDDWGVHPSTTQHLVLNMPPEDTVIWVDSIGMRQPRLRALDIKRIWRRVRDLAGKPHPDKRLYRGSLRTLKLIRPMIIPWHLSSSARRFNEIHLGRAIRRQKQRLDMHDPVLLTSYPAVVRYLDCIPHRKTVYLRLDDYMHYPGADSELVLCTEQEMLDRADVVFATATALLPSGQFAAKSHYLSQGVQYDHFTRVALDPPGGKVLGFFGAISEWIDFDLIKSVAEAAPEWRLDFIGRIEYLPQSMTMIRNVRFLPAVPFAALPDVMSTWTAAWVPFKRNELTQGVNPLKVREYLAAGLATHSTSLPEVTALHGHVEISDRPEDVVHWMQDVFAHDNPEAREVRRLGVQGDSWAIRCAALRNIVADA